MLRKFIYGVMICSTIGLALALFHSYRFYYLDTELIPNSFEFCGKNIGSDDEAYVEISRWLSEDNSGWKSTPVTYFGETKFYSPRFSVRILGEVTVLNYVKAGQWVQVVKRGIPKYRFSC